MKKIVLLLCAVVLFGCSKEKTIPSEKPQVVVKPTPTPKVDLVKKFVSQGYEEIPSRDTLDNRVKQVRRFCRLAEIPDCSWPIALFYEESKFGFEIDGLKGESCFGQIAPYWISHYLSVERKIFGDMFVASGLEMEMRAAVAAYKYNLDLAQGDPKEAVRRYHHGHKGGEKFADAVERTRAEMTQ